MLSEEEAEKRAILREGEAKREQCSDEGRGLESERCLDEEVA